MALAVASSEHHYPANDDAGLTRNDLLARYHRLREISKQHHSGILKLVSHDALLQQARRLGLARGRTFILDDFDEMFFVYDLAIYTVQAGRSRAVDRYARSAQLAAQSDEKLMLEAMRSARFSILHIERRHETAGLIAFDLFRRAPVWLVDVGLESSLPDGEIIATRLYKPESFSMTAGLFVPFSADALQQICHLLPRRLGDMSVDMVVDDRRFAEAIYSIALAEGAMDQIGYRDPPKERDVLPPAVETPLKEHG